MNRLRILLQYDAGKYIHLAIVVTLTILSRISYLAIGILLVELFILHKHSKRLFAVSLVMILLIGFRINLINSQLPNGSFSKEGYVGEVFEDCFYFESDERILIYYDGTDSLDSGMMLEVSGYYHQITTKDIMNTFDYPTYLKSKGIVSVGTATSISIIGNRFSLLIIRQKLSKYIDNTFDETSAKYLKMFILGINDLEDSDKYVANSLGISHLFAMSGMHLGFLIGFISAILTRLKISNDKIRIILIFLVILYNIISGFRTSLVRASLLIMGIYVKDFLGLMLSKTDILSFIYIIFLVFNPYYIYSIGFELSFLVAFVLILGKQMTSNKNPVIRIVITTLIATAVSLPILLSMNRQIGLAFVFANLVLIMYLTYIFLPATVLAFIFPFLGGLYKILVIIFERIIDVFDTINITFDFSFPNNLYKILFWATLLWIFMHYRNKKRVVMGFMSLILILLISMTMNFESERFVRFLDVGQGDAIHIHDTSCDMLIDTGDSDSHDTITDYFLSYNLRKLDFLIITHFHSDHYAETNDLLKRIQVSTIYSSHESDLIDANIQILDEGDGFTCGLSEFQVLSGHTEDTNENNNSLVLYARIGTDSYLFTGDAESEIEDNIINKYHFSIDVLKVGHHGSETSSTGNFLNMLEPHIAIICVGENNRYDFPEEKVLQSLSNIDATVYRTDTDGTITIHYYEIVNLRVIEIYKKQKLRRYLPSIV